MLLVQAELWSFCNGFCPEDRVVPVAAVPAGARVRPVDVAEAAAVRAVRAVKDAPVADVEGADSSPDPEPHN